MNREEALPAWEKESEPVGVGEGKLAITIGADRSVSGTSSGALGDLVIIGRLEADTLSFILLPRDPTISGAFQGCGVAKPAGKALSGSLQASTGDGVLIRAASFELRRSP